MTRVKTRPSVSIKVDLESYRYLRRRATRNRRSAPNELHIVLKDLAAEDPDEKTPAIDQQPKTDEVQVFDAHPTYHGVRRVEEGWAAEWWPEKGKRRAVLGVFSTPQEAAQVYDSEVRIKGADLPLNFPGAEDPPPTPEFRDGRRLTRQEQWDYEDSVGRPKTVEETSPSPLPGNVLKRIPVIQTDPKLRRPGPMASEERVRQWEEAMAAARKQEKEAIAAARAAASASAPAMPAPAMPAPGSTESMPQTAAPEAIGPAPDFEFWDDQGFPCPKCHSYKECDCFPNGPTAFLRGEPEPTED